MREIVMITRRQFNATASAALLVPSVTTVGARAAAWPTRVVRIIVPFAAGGPTDVIGRIVGEQLSKTWGQQVVIENRPGGGTNIANELVVHSEPDGHTVLMGGQSQATTRALYRSLNYDPIGDFAPVAFICGYSFFMFVPNSLPVKSVREFVAYAEQTRASSRSPHRAQDHHRIFAASCSSTWPASRWCMCRIVALPRR
jgi:tripartite-type tricarboxylate transporter receptor subunit TctC